MSHAARMGGCSGDEAISCLCWTETPASRTQGQEGARAEREVSEDACGGSEQGSVSVQAARWLGRRRFMSATPQTFPVVSARFRPPLRGGHGEELWHGPIF